MTRNLCGLITPFQRDRKQDFAFCTGTRLALSNVEQVLMTQGATSSGAGELPWRCEFGSPLHILRHAPADQATQALARSYIETAFAQWLPELHLVSVTVSVENTQLRIYIRFTDGHAQQHALTLRPGGTHA